MQLELKNKTVYFLSVFFTLLAILILPSKLYGQAGDVELPQDPTAYVNDYTGYLEDEWKNKAESAIVLLEEQTSAEIGVAVIDSLEGLTIEEYAFRLFEEWKIGKAEEDNGVLLLIAISDRKLRIEVGYGLEGALTDLEAKNIIDDTIVPYFKSSDYGEGTYYGVLAIAENIYEEYGIENEITEEIPVSSGTSSFNFFNPAFCCCFPAFFIVALIIFLVNLFKRRCPQCRRFWALKIKQRVIKKSTYTTRGRKIIERTCKYCSFKDEKEVSIPKKSRSTFIGGSGSGGSFSSGGGFSGFGGGFSGGGGASGGW